MSVQWFLVANVLYAEVAFTALLLLPIVSPKTWRKLFKSKFLQRLGHANFYSTGFLIILIVLFFDSIREMRKQSALKGQEIEDGRLDSDLQHSMKLFRAQRNCYTAGFALFLCFVIQRLMILISSQAQLMAETRASLRQAKSASDAFEMRHSTSSVNEEITAPNPSNDELVTILEVHEQDVRTLRNELTESKGELIKLGIECDTVKKQTAILGKEYDGLMIQHEKLKNEVAAVADSKNGR